MNDDQKSHMQVFQDITKHLQTEPDLFCRIITSDEIGIPQYDQEIKHSTITKAKESKSVMLITFYDVKGHYQI